MHPARSSLDLAATLLLALLAAVAALTEVGTAIQAAVTMPLVFWLPGHCLTLILLTPRSAGRAERVVYSIVLSLAVTVLTGLAAQVFVDLDRTVWALTLAAVTCVLATVAVLARRRSGSGPAASWALPSLASSLSIGLAVVVAAVAVVVASDGAADTRSDARFTELSIRPVEETVGTVLDAPAVVVSVRNHEGTSSSFRLRVSQGGERLLNQGLSLQNGERWNEGVELEGADAGSVRAVLVRDGEAYRRVDLAPAQVETL